MNRAGAAQITQVRNRTNPDETPDMGRNLRGNYSSQCGYCHLTQLLAL